MKDKVAVVTGGTSGFGRLTVENLTAKGVKVVFCGRRWELGSEIVEKIQNNGGDVAFFHGDVSCEEMVKELIEFTVKTYGRLDLAVNNAGIMTENAQIADSNTAKFEEMIKTNILGVYFSLKYEIKQMLLNGGGSIVNVASVVGSRPMPHISCYSTTKYAVIGLTQNAAIGYAANNIRVNSCSPGASRTELIENMIARGEFDEYYIASLHPLGRLGKPQEMVNGILWLLSDEAFFVTGLDLRVDGGFGAK